MNDLVAQIGLIAVWGVAYVAYIAVHEAGHYVAARLLGVPAGQVELRLFPRGQGLLSFGGYVGPVVRYNGTDGGDDATGESGPRSHRDPAGVPWRDTRWAWFTARDWYVLGAAGYAGTVVVLLALLTIAEAASGWVAAWAGWGAGFFAIAMLIGFAIEGLVILRPVDAGSPGKPDIAQLWAVNRAVTAALGLAVVLIAVATLVRVAG